MLRVLSRKKCVPRVFTKSYSRTGVYHSTTLIARHNSSLSSVTDSAIQELKHLSFTAGQDTSRASKLHDTDKLLAGTYSSSYDSIFRETNTGEILRLWSLLEVCLESDQFERALTLLDTLEPLIKEDNLPFINDLNRYLQKWSSKVSYKQLNEFSSTWSSKYGVPPDGKTYAILATSLMNQKNDPRIVLERYPVVHELKSVFSNIEIIGIDNLKKLVYTYGYDISLIPKDYRHLIEETKEDDLVSEEKFSYFDGDSEELPPTLSKGVDDLKAVDTFGMRAIRHTLLALEPHLNKKLFENLESDLIGKFNFLSLEGQSETSFFKIYKSLPQELQGKFESALDDFNQARQRQLENRAILAAQERWKHDYEELKSKGSISVSKKLNATLWRWSEDLLPLIQEEIERCKNIDTVDTTLLSKPAKAQHNERANYAAFFRLLPAKKLSAITILELLKLNSTGGVVEGMRTARAVVGVANALELEFRSEQLLKSESKLFKDQLKNSKNLKKYVQSLASFKSEKLSDWKFIWPHEIKVKIGSLLISMLMHVAKVEVEGVDPITKKKMIGEAPAFYHSYQYQNSVKVGVLKIHRSIGSQLSADSLVGTIQPQLLPMLVKPRPWTSWNNGGYLYSQGFLIRSRDAPEQMAYLKASSDKLGQVYQGLNVLGETSWTINERVLNIMSVFWNKGDEFLDIPPIQDKLILPDQPPRNADPSVIFEWKSKVKKLTNEFNNNRSIRCDNNYKLEIARAFLGEKIYFPHNLDFRGRAYPLSPNLNHLGNDLSRGLLIFWEGRPLGEKGLDWLKIHFANLFGIDKAPLSERIAFAEDSIEKILKTSDDPLGNKDWWSQADKPWQALATIFELADALRSPDPTKFISHQPVHQDGTCNGLQHYAALGGDVEGARQVNLAPADRPQDVYSYVANLVRGKLEKEAAEGNELAIALKDKIKRKVVKQTVMTNVYGVTYIGATNQIDKQLSEVFPDEDTYRYSVYLTKHVFGCIRELFEGAHLIQDWLAICAKMISSSVRIDLDSKQLMKRGENSPPFLASVIWTTPLDLPIVQPYRALQRKQISTNIQTIYITDPFSMNPVDSRKQMAAFPPNFIHSLDATHMLMSAIACHKANIQFASVHDSYWTHAGDVDIMNECLRNEFIKLHEVDLIERLKEEFQQRYKGFLRLVKIPKLSEAGQRVAAKRKELSKQLGRKVNLADEIYLERRRQSLLSSEDPPEVLQGKELETTVSILEEEDLDSLIQVKKVAKKSKKAKDVEQAAVEEVDSSEEATAKKSTDMSVLVPLRLPPIPPKGDFDVQELRNSKYFFS